MIVVREAHEGDKPQILARVAEVFGSAQAARVQGLWRWRWDQNPQITPPGYRGVVAEWRDQIIGNLSLLPAGLFVRGEEVPSFWCIDMLVHTGLYRQALRDERSAGGGRTHQHTGDNPTTARRHGIAEQMFDYAHADAILFGKHLSEAIRVVTIKTGFRDFDRSGYWIRHLSFTQRISRGVGRWLAPVIAVVPNAALGRVPQPERGVAIFDGDFDDSFDELWQEARATYPAITLRDTRTLQWRYRQRPDVKYITLTVRDATRLRGYAIVRTFEKRQVVRGRIVDLLTAVDDRATRRDLLFASMAVLRDRGADRVTCYASDGVAADALAETGFKPTKPPFQTCALGLDAPDFYGTAGDGDAD
ncbi:MAG: hypothetical protein ACE5K9_09610 [Candidatus Methylomirabilales bacterium]